MDGITYSVSINDQKAQARLDELLAQMANPAGFYKNVAEHLLNSTRDNFGREASPDGVPWKKLMPRTIRERERKRLVPITILRARGRLTGSIHPSSDSSSARLSTPVPYAAVHQLGGKIKKKERVGTVYQHYDAKTDTLDQTFRKKSKSNFARDVKIKAHEIDMPARPYMGIGPDDVVAIIRIAETWLTTEKGPSE